MSTFVGMDVDQVQQLSKDLRAQAERIEDVSGRIDDLIRRMGTIWRGTDAERFADWWSSQHRPAVRAVHDAIEGLAQSAKNNADDQARASGQSAPAGHGPASGTGGANAPISGPTTTPPVSQAASAQAPQGPQAYSVDTAIAKALAEDGTSRPTGFNQPGECIKSVQRWIIEAGGKFVGGGVVDGYVNSGAVQIANGEIVKGDVIQYTSLTNPNGWLDGVHTVMVTGVNSDGTYQIAQSNANYTGKVSLDSHWTPHPPAGFEARAWRFGQH